MKYALSLVRLVGKNLFITGIGSVNTDVIPGPKTGPMEMETSEHGVIAKVKGKTILIPWSQVVSCEGVSPVIAESAEGETALVKKIQTAIKIAAPELDSSKGRGK